MQSHNVPSDNPSNCEVSLTSCKASLVCDTISRPKQDRSEADFTVRAKERLERQRTIERGENEMCRLPVRRTADPRCGRAGASRLANRPMKEGTGSDEP